MKLFYFVNTVLIIYAIFGGADANRNFSTKIVVTDVPPTSPQPVVVADAPPTSSKKVVLADVIPSLSKKINLNSCSCEYDIIPDTNIHSLSVMAKESGYEIPTVIKFEFVKSKLTENELGSACHDLQVKQAKYSKILDEIIKDILAGEYQSAATRTAAHPVFKPKTFIKRFEKVEGDILRKLIDYTSEIENLRLRIELLKDLMAKVKEIDNDNLLDTLVIYSAVHKLREAEIVKPHYEDLVMEIEDRILVNLEEIILKEHKFAELKLKESKYITRDYNNPTDLEKSLFLERIYAKFIPYIFDKVNLQRLVEVVVKYVDDYDVVIQGLDLIFKNMREFDQTNDAAIILLARYIERFSRVSELSSQSKAYIEMIKERLSSSVKALAFSENVCVKNYLRNEYLFAEEENNNNDSIRREVYTWIPKTGGYQENIWTFENDLGIMDADVFHIKNKRFEEYLYVSDRLYDDSRYEIFTRLPESVDEAGEGQKNFEWKRWKVIIHGENVYLKNYLSFKYMYAAGDEFKKDQNRRRIFGWKEESPLEEELWVLEAC